MSSTSTGKHAVPAWAPKVSLGMIRRLYEMDARGLVDEALIDKVGYALLDRCESIRRVTHRLCPACGGPLRGAFEPRSDRERPIVCESCGWASIWRVYHRSYKGRRIHGGRAFPAFTAFIEQFPNARCARDKMLAIDALIHAVHEAEEGLWTLPGAINLLKGKHWEIIAALDELAGLDGARAESVRRQQQLREKLEASERRMRQCNRDAGRRPTGDFMIMPLDEDREPG